jgi:hypothetical protein
MIVEHGRVRYCRDFGMGIGLLCGLNGGMVVRQWWIDCGLIAWVIVYGGGQGRRDGVRISVLVMTGRAL